MESINKAILEKVYKDKLIISLISRQIQELLYDKIQLVGQSILIHLQVPSKSQNYCFQFSEQIKFIIEIGKGFPIHPPKLYLLSAITVPRINDLRNLSSFLIKQWSYKISLSNFVSNLPKLLTKLATLNHLQLQQLGKFQTNKIYSIKFLKHFQIQYFYGFESNEDDIELFVIIVTQTHFLLMKSVKQPYFQGQKLKVPKQEQIDEVHLVFGCQLQAISQIQIDNENYLECIFKFQCFHLGKDFCQKITRQRTLKIGNCKQLLAKIFKAVSKFQTTRLSLQNHYQTPQEEEIISKIRTQQKIYRKQKTKKEFQTLIQLYRQAVEYYSAIFSPYYIIYMNKIQNVCFHAFQQH